MSANEIQTLLRFLTQDAKVPLATAMGKIKDLQKAKLDSADSLAKAKPEALNPIFGDDKIAKQVIAAAKRVAKKRAAGDESGPSPRKKKKDVSLFLEGATTVEDLEASLALPDCADSEAELFKTTLITNRAPLALAFVFTLLKHTMPDQPLSSRLSLAQGYIGITSRARAVSLGIESGKSAEEEGFGEGQPSVTVAGQQIRILRRWGYEWKREEAEGGLGGTQSTEGTLKAQSQGDADEAGTSIKAESDGAVTQDEPAVWALDLEALKKSNISDSATAAAGSRSGGTTALPIYTPQSARNYLLKAFETAHSEGNTPLSKKPSDVVARKEKNLGKLLRALDLLYQSWASTLSPEELDKRTWPWYVKARPSVEHGVAGWGEKNVLKLADILALKREV